MSENKNNKLDLENLSKEAPFVVPEGYFDSFPNRIMKKIQAEDEKQEPKKSIRLNTFFNPQLSIAASLILFAILSYFTITYVVNSKHNQDSQYFAELVENDIEDYDLLLIMEALDETYYSDEEEYIIEQDEEIINYLVSEEIDLEVIIEEL